eukprot:COSAG05_NODE_187_length_14703_cov_123.022186_10_plen_301_part_00
MSESGKQVNTAAVEGESDTTQESAVGGEPEGLAARLFAAGAKGLQTGRPLPRPGAPLRPAPGRYVPPGPLDGPLWLAEGRPTTHSGYFLQKRAIKLQGQVEMRERARIDAAPIREAEQAKMQALMAEMAEDKEKRRQKLAEWGRQLPALRAQEASFVKDVADRKYLQEARDRQKQLESTPPQQPPPPSPQVVAPLPQTAAGLVGALFDCVDADGSGFLERQEGHAFLKVAGCAENELDYYWRDLKRAADKNGDGQITKQEFVSFILAEEGVDAAGCFTSSERRRELEAQLKMLNGSEQGL